MSEQASERQSRRTAVVLYEKMLGRDCAKIPSGQLLPECVAASQSLRKACNRPMKIPESNLVQEQLAKALDHHCESLGLQGARGTLFKITLASHGYVFVGKGTVQAFVPDLLHEGKTYQRLAKLQGTAVPVCLRNIGLYQWYYLDLGVEYCTCF